MHHRPTSSILRDTSGTTIIEFAVVAPLFLLIFFAVIEFGLYTFTKISLEMAVDTAGRNVTINTDLSAPDRVTAFRNEIQQKAASLINGDKVIVTANVINDHGAGGTSNPDICLTDPPSTPATGGCPSGTPYIDTNHNSQYDGPDGVTLGTGGSVVELNVSLPWQVQLPFMQSFFVSKDNGGNDVQGIALMSATTVIKNEPL